MKPGEYVVATKYSDGDPGDPFCIGFYWGYFNHYGTLRYLVVDNEGQQFRHNGFRRVQRVSSRRGAWMVLHLAHIERQKDQYSVWHWVRAPWKELLTVDED